MAVDEKQVETVGVCVDGINPLNKGMHLKRWECPECGSEMWVKADDLKRVYQCPFCGWSKDYDEREQASLGEPEEGGEAIEDHA
jgi:predicted RNA-binding Zn-ribbon protein involved in translation (DUF1610 family)